MDSSAIQEIANQLGVTTDKVWELAPEYGAMMVGSGLVEIASLLIAFVLFTTLLAISYKKRDEYMPTAWDVLFVISIIPTIVCGVALIITLFTDVGDMWAWANYPQATMAKLVISNIG